MAGTNPKNPIKASPAEIREKSRKLLHIYNLPKINLDSDEEVEERINYYFEYCMQEGLKPTVEGLAIALGITRQALHDWQTGRRRGESSSRRADMVKKAKDYIAFLLSDYALDNKVYPATWIFYAKNYFGMTDKHEIEVKANQPLGEELSPEEIAKRVGLPDPNEPVDVEWKE